jgi:uncharacterized protein YegP (UPF0339 family)
MAGEVDLKISPSGKYMFNLKAGNGQWAGQVILIREIYESKRAAEGGIASVKANAADDRHRDEYQVLLHPSYSVIASGSFERHFRVKTFRMRSKK